MTDNKRKMLKYTKRTFTWLGYVAIIVSFVQLYQGTKKDQEIANLAQNMEHLTGKNNLLSRQLITLEEMFKESVDERQNIIESLKRIDKNNDLVSKLLELINKSEATVEKDIAKYREVKNDEIKAFPSEKMIKIK